MAEEPTPAGEGRTRHGALNERRVWIYRQLMDAEDRLDGVRRRRGLEQAQVAEAVEPLEAEPDDHGEAYIAALGKYVAALGGHLEITAVFAEESVILRRVPSDSEDPSGG